jgi:hypothetical protein
MTLLDDLAAQSPAPQPVQPSASTGDSVAWLDAFLAKHAGKLPAMGEWESYQGGRRLVFEVCPWNPDHRNSSAFLIQRADGVIQAGCHHNGCTQETWHTLRAMVSPKVAPPPPTRKAPTPEPAKPTTTPSDPLASYIQLQNDSIAGKRDSLLFPWPRLTRAARALVPGTVTLFVGEGGSTKSLLMMQCLAYWNQCMYQPAIFEVEDDAEFHLARAHAQIAGEAGFTESGWLKGEDLFNSDPATLQTMREARHAYVRQCTEQNREVLSEIRRSIWDRTKPNVTLTELAVWVEARAKDKHQIIVVDPVSAAAKDEKPWIADDAFLDRVELIAREYCTRIVLMLHPRKGAKGSSTLDDIAGGASYGRRCHNVIWIEVYDKDEQLKIRPHWKYPAELCVPNRIMKIVKSRNGPGRGSRIAFDFDSKSLTFTELGLIEKS